MLKKNVKFRKGIEEKVAFGVKQPNSISAAPGALRRFLMRNPLIPDSGQ